MKRKDQRTSRRWVRTVTTDNRGGRGLSKTRREELERAKRLLSERIRRRRERARAGA